MSRNTVRKAFSYPDGRLRRAGLSSWLIEVGSGAAAAALYRYLTDLREQGKLPAVIDLVPGARTVLLDAGEPGPRRGALVELLRGWHGGPPAPGPRPRLVEIPVTYDGVDLAEVARLTGLTGTEVIAAHTGAEMTVAFCGFAPGFAYLAGLPQALRLPRLAEPRTAVPAGSVALAEEYTGIYPRRSPGGWRIIGHTSVQVWHERDDPPALLTPGTRVRFIGESR